MQSPEQGAPSVIIANDFDDNNHVDNNGDDDDNSYDGHVMMALMTM